MGPVHRKRPHHAPPLVGRRPAALPSGAPARLRWLQVALALCAAVLTLASAPAALAIRRSEVLARAQWRVDAPVPYSQKAYYGGYRTDCSGYVSMCWATGTSWTTRTFHYVTTPIPVDQLKPGDALLKPGWHIRLFYGWLDEARTRYVAYESGYGLVAVARIHSIAEDLASGYRPVRYDRIADGPPPANLLKNGGFNTWTRPWSGAPLEPTWWEPSDPPIVPVALKRTDVYVSPASALELINPSGSSEETVALAQSVRIVPGARYAASVRALSGSDPRALALRLAFTDASGTVLAERLTTGERVGVNALTWRTLSLVATAPLEAVRARFEIRLAGGECLDASGTAWPGTSVILDSAALVRPRLSTTVQPSTTAARRPVTIAVRGTVAPTTPAIGTTATLEVLPPGGSWRPVGSTAVRTDGSGRAAWAFSYRLGSRAPAGTYRFRTRIAPAPGYLGTTSATVSVRVR